MQNSVKCQFFLILLLSLVFIPATASAPADSTDAALDSLLLSIEGMELDEIVVTARRPIVESDGATLTYNVTEDPSAASRNVLDMMRQVPMVTVDAQNQIKLNGSTDFKIYVNGKPDKSLSDNAKTILKAMPAASIRKIEVITEPGAKYDAEGTAGIINIITSGKLSVEGYLANITAFANYTDAGGAAYVRTSVGNVSASLNMQYTNGRWNKTRTFGMTETEYLDPSSPERYITDSIAQKNAYDYRGANFNLSWEPDTANLFTLGFNCFNFRGDAEFTRHARGLDDDRDDLWGYYVHAAGGEHESGLNANASYRHNFDTDRRYVIATYQYDRSYTPLDALSHYYDASSFTPPATYQRDLNRTTNNQHTAQVDFVNRFGDIHTLEAGVKGLFRRNGVNSFLYYGDSEECLTSVASGRVRMSQYQDIGAAYASYNADMKRLTVRAGVRYEYTSMGVSFRAGDYNDFSKRLSDLVPNAAVTYRFDESANLRLGYQMRISRPTVSQLNPYRLQLQANSYRTGNPDLTCERFHKLMLTYSNYGNDRINGNIGLSYVRRDNMISNYIYLDDNGMRINTYANVGTRDRIALIGYGSWNIIANMSLSLNGETRYAVYNHKKTGSRNDGWSAFVNADWNYTLPCGLKVNAFGGISTSSPDVQGSSGSWSYYGFGANKSFLKDGALTVGCFAGNIFNRYQTYRETIRSNDMVLHNAWTNQHRNFGISLTWKFGNLKSDIKSTGASVDNNDSAGGSGESRGR